MSDLEYFNHLYDHYHPEERAEYSSESYNREWTIEMVKDELPNVRVQWQGAIWLGMIRGRRLQFPLVCVFRRFAPPAAPNSDNIRGPERDCAWQTIVDSLNTGNPILFN